MAHHLVMTSRNLQNWARLSPLLGELPDLPKPQRAARLDAMRGENPQLGDRAHEPVSARADLLGYRTANFIRRHRGAVAAGTLTMLAIVGGLVGTVTQGMSAAEQATIAAHERDRAVRELTASEATSEFLAFLLSEDGDRPFTAPKLLARGD